MLGGCQLAACPEVLYCRRRRPLAILKLLPERSRFARRPPLCWNTAGRWIFNFLTHFPSANSEAHGQFALAARIAGGAQTSSRRLYNLARGPSFACFPFFSSLALFAFWLRSSVVSVLFSLISETTLRSRIVIILIFVFWPAILWACP
ncbi:hypothetical protein QBC35DRAFT_128791 [Podospora australis]|uniref:Uncharacterized protein n=1 Tax=Podospora australis TaxID=1536484 RepID=A0AAN6WYR7_9PEZI|nr:hypothetical protein QBC35DRAFT_128791 [Podospora australis]